MRVEVRTTGTRSHSARAWMGHNAIHDAGEVLRRLSAYEPREVEIDGLRLPRGPQRRRHPRGRRRQRHPRRVRRLGQLPLRAVALGRRGRGAPARGLRGVRRHVVDAVDGALPGLAHPAAAAFVAAVGGAPTPKFGWTDVARFTALGVPAVNYGPGNPSLAHHRDEFAPVAHLRGVEAGLRAWLTS